MKKKLFLLALICVTFSSLAQSTAQTEYKDLNWKFGVGLVPQYAIVSGMRLDFDLKLDDRQYLTIAPQMYYNKHYKMFYPEETDMRGLGMNLNYRYIFTKSELPQGPYLGFGLVYKYYDLDYMAEGWRDYMSLSSTFYEEGILEKKMEFNQFGYDLLIGYQGTYDRFFYDFFIGWGFRLSDFDEDASEDDFWGETIFDPGYSGFLPTIGFRAGIFLK